MVGGGEFFGFVGSDSSFCWAGSSVLGVGSSESTRLSSRKF